MTETAEHLVVQHMEDQKAFFATNQTKDIHFRIQQLQKLKQAIVKYQTKIENALWEDLHKSPEEAYLSEISIVTGEIDNHIKHLKKWANRKGYPPPCTCYRHQVKYDMNP